MNYISGQDGGTGNGWAVTTKATADRPLRTQRQLVEMQPLNLYGQIFQAQMQAYQHALARERARAAALRPLPTDAGEGWLSVVRRLYGSGAIR